jgi:hypothetical protein
VAEYLMRLVETLQTRTSMVEQTGKERAGKKVLLFVRRSPDLHDDQNRFKAIHTGSKTPIPV